MRDASPLMAASAEYIRSLEDQYRLDPASVDPSWHCLFQALDDIDGASITVGAPSVPDDRARADAIRRFGHLSAQIDPLAERQNPRQPARLEELLVSTGASVRELEERYGGALALEVGHLDDPKHYKWLCEAYESLGDELPPQRIKRILQKLIAADEFEQFLGRKFPTKKRFGAEGAEALVPMLDQLLLSAAAAGVTHVVIGTMHRGRLNIVSNVLGKSTVQLLAEIKGAHPFPCDAPRAGDVPYHLGFEADAATNSEQPFAKLVLLPNPSHLEAVDPVILGRARALQELVGEHGFKRVLPIILHTDAAVVAQGVVAETLQLAQLEGFSTAGTIHIVVNNQIGFTTEIHEARSSTYCTSPWKALDSAILHVNGDDPLMACRATDLALRYRQQHGQDAVIDLVCYRRNGHNEVDEPAYTQPTLYRGIEKHQPVAALFTAQLVKRGLVEADAVERQTAAYRDALEKVWDKVKDFKSDASGYPGGRWSRYLPLGDAPEPLTGVAESRLVELAASLTRLPEGMRIHKRLTRILGERAITTNGIPWPLAESLAFATLLTERTAVRFTGQDVVRGAFSHRHFALVDVESGSRYISLNHLEREQERFAVFNSPLSEYAVLGFEYGYSLERPDTLVIWEAQFGDFANGAQIIIDHRPVPTLMRRPHAIS